MFAGHAIEGQYWDLNVMLINKTRFQTIVQFLIHKSHIKEASQFTENLNIEKQTTRTIMLGTVPFKLYSTCIMYHVLYHVVTQLFVISLDCTLDNLTDVLFQLLHVRHGSELPYFCMWQYPSVIAILLTRSGVEVNPGPSEGVCASQHL